MSGIYEGSPEAAKRSSGQTSQEPGKNTQGARSERSARHMHCASPVKNPASTRRASNEDTVHHSDRWALASLLAATACGTATGAAVGAGTGAAVGAGTGYGAGKGA